MKISLNCPGLFAGLVLSALLTAGCHCPRKTADSQASCCAPAATTAAAAASVPPTKETQTAMTPAQALTLLRGGNERFVSGHPLTRDFPAEVKATAGGQ